MTDILVAFARGVLVGAGGVAWYARRIIVRIRADWKTATRLRDRSPA